MSASGTISRMAGRVLRCTADIAELQGTLFLAPVLSQCAFLRRMAHSASMQQPQWHTEAAGDPARSGRPPSKAGGLAQRRRARSTHQQKGMPFRVEAAAAVPSSQASCARWYPVPSSTSAGAAATHSSPQGVSAAVHAASNSGQARGTAHWTSSFEPVQEPKPQELGDPLSLAILGTTSTQQLQQLAASPPSPWQPHQVVLALTRLVQLAGDSTQSPPQQPAAMCPQQHSTSGSTSSSGSTGTGTSVGVHVQQQTGMGQASSYDRRAVLTSPPVREQANALVDLLLRHMQPAPVQPVSSSSSSARGRRGQDLSHGATSPWAALSPHQLAALMDAGVQLGLKEPALWQGCLEGLLAAGDSASGTSLVTALQSLAVMTRAEASLTGQPLHGQHFKEWLVSKQRLQAVVQACCNQAGTLTPSSIRSVLQSATTLGVDLTPQQVEQLSAAFRGRMTAASPITLTWFLQGLARAGHAVPGPLVEEVVAALLDRLEAAPSAASAAEALYGLAKLGARVPARLLQPLAAQLLLQQGQGQGLHSPTVTSRGLWSLARLHRARLLPPECLPPGVVEALLQQLLRHPRLPSKVCANSLWAAAVLQQPVQSGTLEALVMAFNSVLPHSNTQEVANMVWATALVYSACLPLAEGCAAAAIGQDADDVPLWTWEDSPQQQQQQQQQQQGHHHQQQPSRQLERLPEWPRHKQELPACTPGQEAVLPVLQGVLPGWLGFLAQHARRAAAQELSISLWAAYYLQRSPLAADKLGPMLDALADRVAAGKYTTVDIANALWASAQYRWYPQRLVNAWLAGRRYERNIATADPRELSVFANASARLGVGDAGLIGAVVKRAHQLIDRHGGCHSRPLRQLASQVAWAVAVLDQRQLAPQLRPLAAACFAPRMALPPQELVQWRQVHTWLADTRLWDQAGLQAVLRPEQMAACTAAWRQQAAHIQDSSTSQMQRDVFRALQKLAQHVLPGLTVHGMEQLDAEDGYAIIDIVADYAGRRLAIEVDGPRHWLRPDQRASGPSLARNRSLETRGYSVVVVDGGKWDTLRVVSGKLRYLMGIICAAVGEEPPSEAWDRCGRWQQLRGHR